MSAVFADTFYWAAVASTEDAAHEQAMEFGRHIAPRAIVTTFRKAAHRLLRD